MALVARVSAENQTVSHLCICPIFNNDCINARFAELPLLKKTQYFLPCRCANNVSNFLQYSPILNCFAH